MTKKYTLFGVTFSFTLWLLLAILNDIFLVVLWQIFSLHSKLLSSRYTYISVHCCSLPPIFSRFISSYPMCLIISIKVYLIAFNKFVMYKQDSKQVYKDLTRGFVRDFVTCSKFTTKPRLSDIFSKLCCFRVLFTIAALEISSRFAFSNRGLVVLIYVTLMSSCLTAIFELVQT